MYNLSRFLISHSRQPTRQFVLCKFPGILNIILTFQKLSIIIVLFHFISKINQNTCILFIFIDLSGEFLLKKCVWYIFCLFFIDFKIPRLIQGLFNCLLVLQETCLTGACLLTISLIALIASGTFSLR